MANARPLYLNAGKQTQLQESDVLNANALEVFGTVPSATLNLFNTAGAYAVNLLTGTTGNVTVASASTGTVGFAAAAATVQVGATATTLTIGGASTEVGIPGNLTVDGDENVIGTTTFEGDTVIGQGGDDTLTIDADVNSDIDFDNAASRTIRMLTGTANNLTMTNAGTGALTLSTSSGALNVTSGGAFAISGASNSTISAANGNIALSTTSTGSSAAISIAPASGYNFSVTTLGSGAVTVNSGASIGLTATTSASLSGVGLTLEAGSGGFSLQGDTSSTINVANNNLALTTTGGGNVNMTAAQAVNITSTGANNVTITSGSGVLATSTSGTNDALSLTVDSGGTPKTADIMVGSGSPDTVVTGSRGDLYLDVSNGAPYYCTSFPTGTAWTQVGSSSPVYSSLQQAYDAGQTIQMNGTTKGDLVIYTDDTVDRANFILRNEADSANYLATDSANAKLTLGASGATVTVGFAGYVDTGITFEGPQTLTTSSGKLTLGAANAMDIVPTAGALTITAPASSTWSTSSGALTLTSAAAATWSTAAGALDITGTGGLNLTGTNSLVAIDSGTAATTITSGGASSWTNDTGSLDLITTTSGSITLNSIASVNIASDAYSYFRVDGADLDLSTTTSGTVNAYGVDGVEIGSASGTTVTMFTDGTNTVIGYDAANVSIPDTEYAVNLKALNTATAADEGKILHLQNNQVAAAEAGIQVYSGNPDNVLDANYAGDICLSNDGHLYVATASGTAGWEPAITSSTLTLQGAYDSGNAIITAGGRNIDFTLTSGAFYVTTSSGNNITFDNGTYNFLVCNGTTGQTTLASTSTNLILTTNVSGNVNVQPANNGNINLVASGTGDLTVNADAITMDAGSDSYFTVTTGNLTLSTSGSGNVVVHAITSLDMDGDAGFSLSATGGSGYISTTNGTLALSTNTVGQITVIPAINNNLTMQTSGTGNINLWTGLNGTIYVGNNGSEGTVIVDSSTLQLLAISTATLKSTGANVEIQSPAGSTNITSASNGTFQFGNTGLAVTATGSTGDISLTAGTTTGDVVLTAGTLSGGLVNVDGYAIDVDSGAGGIALTSVDGGIILTATNASGNNISFQAHSVTAVPFNDTTYTDLNSFPASYRTLCGALVYLLNQASDVKIDVVSGEAYSLGDALYLSTSDNKAYKCDADAAASSVFIGIAAEAATAADQPHPVYVAGEVVVSTDLAAIANGTVLYLDTVTAGGLTATAPSGSGDTVLRVGVVSQTASDKMVIQVGEPVQL